MRCLNHRCSILLFNKELTLCLSLFSPDSTHIIRHGMIEGRNGS